MSNWNPEEEQRNLLQFANVMEPHYERLKAALPPGTQFGILVIAPALVPGDEGRIVAMTTDREKIGVAAAQWILQSKPFGGRNG